MAVVGIDLGTTNTVIAAVRDGRATALKDKLGRALLPSVVSFSPKGTPKVGYEAKDRRTIDPDNTVFSVKRLIGRTFDSEHVQKALARLPFELKEGPGKATLVSCYGTDYTLPEISAMVLEQAQKIAETRLGGTVADAVITVPANFNDLQRAATKVAGRTAGLEVLRIINEPTAAALAYGFGKKGRERIAVYDFGGGTFDVTLLDLSENVFEVLATAGDTFLGGDDIDRALMDRMAEELLAKNKIDAAGDNLVREQLRAAAEKLKIDLSTRSMAKANIEDLEFEFSMRRSEFEKLAEPLLARTLEVCQEAMDVAGVGKTELDQVLLVGGSTRIPLVRRRISSFFGKMPQSRINPDEVVAIGAAIQASSLEAKQQNQGSIPAAPRPRAGSPSAHPSRAPSPLGAPRAPGGTTQTGLAGLKKTLSGPDKGRTTENSVLSGMKTVSPSVRPTAAGTQKLGPAKTLSGVGGPTKSSPPVQLPGAKTLSGVGKESRARMGTLAGVGEDSQKKKSSTLSGLNERPKGTTNLGLGAHPSSPPPLGGQAPPKPLGSSPAAAGPGDFDDVTSVVEGADEAAALSESGREKLETIPGSAAPPSTEDGSVTFDLAELEASQGDGSGFDELEDETTQIVDPSIVEANAAALDSGVDADLPMPVSQGPEELGDSALIDVGAMEEEELDLPSPASRQPDELGDSALLDVDEVALPAVPADLPARSQKAFAQTAVGLPSPLADLPTRSAGLPQPSAGLPQPSAGLPQPSAGLPQPSAGLPDPIPESAHDLPLVGAGLPKRSPSGEVRLGLGNTQIAAPQTSELDFDQVAEAAADGDVDAFDELSVAALLPDEGSVATQLPTDELDLSGTNPLGSPAPAHRSPQDSVAEALADAPMEARSPFGSSAPLDAEDGSGLSQLSQMSQSAGPAPGGPLLLDVTPLSLGVEVVGGYVDQLIERNSPVPCERTRTFATAQDNQQLVRIRVSQGEEGRFEANTVLGEVELTGLALGPRGTVKIDVSFSLDESGMLNVSASDPSSGNAANARLMLAGVSS